MYNTNGVILQESADIVVIATGLRSKSSNSKTGGMIQVYILYRHESPLMAIRYGLDSTICGECPHRGVIVNGKAVGRRCYVQVGKAASGIWKCYLRGGYRHADASEYASLFGGRMVRWGAYGDPAFINRDVVEGVSAVASGRTGYSHQWKTAPSWMRQYFMASCDSPQESMLAVRMGWRYFRVSPKGNDTKLTGEISCPASAEAGKRTVCANCKLCDGTREGDRRKNIVIQDHSVIAKKSPLINIAIG
jgi:hypothetical protein